MKSVKKNNSSTTGLKNKNFSVQVKNSQRRNFLRYSIFIIGGFLVGIIFNRFLEVISTKKMASQGFSPMSPSDEQINTFNNFIVRENSNELAFYDKNGYKIFVIDK